MEGGWERYLQRALGFDDVLPEKGFRELSLAWTGLK